MDVDGIFQQQRVLADRAEQVVVLGQRRKDQAHAAGFAAALHDRLVYGAEKLLHVAVAGRLLDVRAMPGGVACGAVGTVRAFAAVGFFVQHGHGSLRCAVRRPHFQQAVAVAFKQREAVAAQAQHLEAVGRLRDAQQWLGVKAVCYHHQIRHRTLQAVHAEQARRTKDCEAIDGVVPEVGIGCQCLKRLQQRRYFALGVLVAQRCLHFLHQVAKPDRVLHVVGVLPVGGLVQRQAWRFAVAQKYFWIVVA